MGYRAGFGTSHFSLLYDTEVVAWQAPVLVQYGRSFGGATPYVSVGATFRVLGSGSETGTSCGGLLPPVCTDFRRGLTNIDESFNTGITSGGGVEFRIGWLQLSPEFRYTRWLNEPFHSPQTNEHQVDLLLRIAIPVLHK
jgi:opacity protein-like surface antigen